MREVKPNVAARCMAGAVFAALAALGGAAVAAEPGYVTSASGDNVVTGYGECWKSGSGAAQADPDCDPALAQASTPAATTPAAATPPSDGSAAAGASTSAAAAGSGAPAKEPGYINLTDGVNVRTAYGECWRAGHWTPAMAAEPCDAIARAATPAPVVAAAPEPQPAPAPVQPEPQPLAAAPLPLIQKVTIETDVLFAFDRAELRESGKQRLDEVAQELRDADVQEVVAIGHTDPIGTDAYNEKLSAERATAVKDYLVQTAGIDNAKVIAEGRGESQPVTGEQCRGMKGPKLISCLQPDRRVEIEVFGSREVAAGEAQPATGATSPASGSSSESGTGSSSSSSGTSN